MSPERSSTARRNQRGATLLELLIVIAIVGLIIAPVATWFISTLQQQDLARNVLRTAVATGRLSSTFSRDVGAASSVTADQSDCTGGGEGNGQVKLSMISSTTGTRMAYAEAPSRGAPQFTSLWKRVCDGNGALESATELFKRIVPNSVGVEVAGRRVGLTLEACPSRPTTAAARCDPALGSTEDVELHAAMRVTPGYEGYAGSAPIAQIQVSPRVGYSDTDFTFDASASRGLGEPGVSVAWSFPTASGGTTSDAVQVTKRFAEAGDHEVTLRITDGEGRTNEAVAKIRVLNRFPTAIASYDAAARVFRGAPDPNGLPLTYVWNFGEGLEPRVGQQVDSPWGPEATGRRRAVLYVTVTGNPNLADTDTVVVDLGTPPAGPITISPTPVEVEGKLPTVGTVGGDRDPLEVTFSGDDEPGLTWRLTRRGSGEQIATGPGPQLVHSFGPLGHGEYEIARVDAAGGLRGDPVAFRVNAAPIAAFQVNAAAAGGATGFAAGGPGGTSDPDGQVLSYRWELGWPGWTATGASPSFVYANPGTYVVKLTVEDDDGAESSTERLVRVTGTPDAPAAPTWNGDRVEWAGVPGAEMYRVTILCTVGAPFVEDVGSAARAVTMPGGFCAGGAVTASLQVRADDRWSSPSPGVNR